MLSEYTAIVINNASDGFFFSKVGGCGRFFGRSPSAALIAVWTSNAAASTLRARSNWTLIELAPSELVDVIEVTPGKIASARSSGDVTDEAIVSALAPGKSALTDIVGISTCGTPVIGNSV